MGQTGLYLDRRRYFKKSSNVSINCKKKRGSGVDVTRGRPTRTKTSRETYRRVTRSGENDDTAGIDVDGGTHGSHGAGLDGAQRSLYVVERSHLLVVADVGDGVLGLEAGLAHLADGQLRVVTLGGLAAEHDAVGTVDDGVADVADLGAGGARVLDHALEHLGSADDRLAGHVAHGDQLLLGGEDLRGGDLDAQVSAGDHDAVGCLEDLAEVVEALPVLDLGDDLDVFPFLA